MKLRRIKSIAAVIGGGAAIALAVVGVVDRGPDAPANMLAGSGASATNTNFVPPSVSPMTLTPAMTLGSTVTAATTPAQQSAVAPTAAASAPATCSDNGVALPGGCH
jgi:hypothetical protein